MWMAGQLGERHGIGDRAVDELRVRAAGGGQSIAGSAWIEFDRSGRSMSAGRKRELPGQTEKNEREAEE